MRDAQTFKYCSSLSSSETTISDFPLINKTNQKLLAIGTHVRILLDHPIDLYSQKR
jgi:hypothetical protein